MTKLSDAQVEERIHELARSMRSRGLAFSDMQARERAREIVLQELQMQEDFESRKDDPSLNPQQQKPRARQVSDEQLKAAGGMLTGNELPKDVPLAELLKGRAREQKK
jgi:hypothetical protein